MTWYRPLKMLITSLLQSAVIVGQLFARELLVCLGRDSGGTLKLLDRFLRAASLWRLRAQF